MAKHNTPPANPPVDPLEAAAGLTSEENFNSPDKRIDPQFGAGSPDPARDPLVPDAPVEVETASYKLEQDISFSVNRVSVRWKAGRIVSEATYGPLLKNQLDAAKVKYRLVTSS